MLSDLEKVFQFEKLEKNKVAGLLRSYKSREEDWKPFAQFTREKYTRNLVRECPAFCAVVLAWGPGHASSIHDHAGANCWVKVLDGELTETRFRPAGEGRGPVRTGQAVVRRDMVTYMNGQSSSTSRHSLSDSLGLHIIANNSPRPAATLHIYAPPFDKCLAFDETIGNQPGHPTYPLFQESLEFPAVPSTR